MIRTLLTLMRYLKRFGLAKGFQVYYQIKSNQIKSNQIKSNQIKSNQIKSNQIKSNQIKSNQIKSNQIKSNQIKSNQIKSNQIKSNQIKSNQIKSNNTCSIHLNDIKYPFILRSKTSDIPTFHQIFINKEYEINLNFNLETIIDAGANIGLAAIFYANKYPKSKIISIEPEQSNYDLLKENTQNYENIITYNNALSNVSDQNLAIVDNGYGNWGFMTEPLTDSLKNKVSSIKSITVHEIMNEYNWETIDLVKIDIEGYEKELFEKNIESWLPYVRCLIIELHDRMKEGCSKSFFNAISKYDFSYFHKGENLVFLNNKLHVTIPKLL